VRRAIVSTKGVVTQPTDDASIIEAMKATDKVLWLDLANPTPEELAFLRDGFGFHPLAIEDVAQTHQVAKLVEYENHVFQVVMVPYQKTATEADVFEIEIFYLKGTIVTVHDRPWEPLEELWTAVQRDPVRELGKGAQVLYHTLVDRAVEAYWPVLDRIDEHVEEIEKQVLAAKGTGETLPGLFRLRRTVRHLLRAARNQRESVLRLAVGTVHALTKETCYQFRDVHDRLLLIHDTLDDHRETLGGLRDTYIGVISNRMNEIMKALTVFSAVMLPLAFLTGLWGMNFRVLPFADSEHGFWIFTGICVAVAALLLRWMAKRGWLRRLD
jgi:magnesium transporter